jgi:hypothetical protein
MQYTRILTGALHSRRDTVSKVGNKQNEILEWNALSPPSLVEHVPQNTVGFQGSMACKNDLRHKDAQINCIGRLAF